MPLQGENLGGQKTGLHGLGDGKTLLLPADVRGRGEKNPPGRSPRQRRLNGPGRQLPKGSGLAGLNPFRDHLQGQQLLGTCGLSPALTRFRVRPDHDHLLPLRDQGRSLGPVLPQQKGQATPERFKQLQRGVYGALRHHGRQGWTFLPHPVKRQFQPGQRREPGGGLRQPCRRVGQQPRQFSQVFSRAQESKKFLPLRRGQQPAAGRKNFRKITGHGLGHEAPRGCQHPRSRPRSRSMSSRSGKNTFSGRSGRGSRWLSAKGVPCSFRL